MGGPIPQQLVDACYLEITSWIGTSLGAEHFYGKLRCSSKEIDIMKKLSAEDARLLNEKDQYTAYTKGTLSSRFETRDEIIYRARKIWKKEFPGARVLILGRSACCDPQEVLVGPSKEFVRKANKLYNEYRKVGWNTDLQETQRICDEWDELFRSIE